jgi:hypothetical protein
MEGNPDWRHRNQRNEDPEGRRNLEMVRLRDTIAQVLAIPIGDPGDPGAKDARFHQLELILKHEPQRDDNKKLRYLVTSGLAVEMITGFERDHHDLDLVIMDPENTKYWELMGTDNVTPGQYWADMKFDPKFLGDNARSVRIRHNKNSSLVEVVHPAILMVQKSSDAFGRPPRKKDKADVDAIIAHWKSEENYTKEWNPLVRYSLDALPPHQVEKTLRRIRQAVG